MKPGSSFVRSTMLMLAVGIVILLVIVASSLWLVHQNAKYSDQTAELRRVRSATIDLFSTIQSAESGQRGFLLTEEPSYLDPYAEAISQLPARRATLSKNIVGKPEYETHLAELDALIDGKVKEMEGTITSAKAGDRAAALDMVATDAGKNSMYAIRRILEGFLAQTDERLRVIVVDQLSAANSLQWVTLGGAIAILLVVGGSVAIILQHVRDLSRAHAELAILNAGLETRVEERTLDLMRANDEIQRFAYIVTHDLRAPLVNIMGFLSEFENGLKDLRSHMLAAPEKQTDESERLAKLAVEEELPEAMGFIRSSTRKMDSLINAILKISRDGRRKLMPETLDLKATIDATASSIYHQISASGGELEISVDVPQITTDRFSLDQILGNLLDNAVKYQKPGRPLKLAITAYAESRNRIRIDVSDNGRGIAERDQERIFELFRRAGDQDQPGEGIGLAYVRSLIRNLGGDIIVRSELDSGSTFILTLPSDLTKIVRSMEP